MKKDNGTVITHYPFGTYESTDTGSTTKHVYAGEMLVATVQDTAASAEVYHNHLDHLNSTVAVSNSVGALDQSLSYYPFGDTLSDVQYGDQRQNIQHTGHYKDDETSLIYMGARYYAGDTGRFTSQDPVSLALGDWKTVQDKTDGKIGFYLSNPQSHNSYSYTANNPLKFVDKNGEFIDISISGTAFGLSGSAGVRFSNKGFNIVGSGGFGGGFGVFPLSVSYVPGEDVVHETNVTDTIGFSVVPILGGGGEQSGEVVNNTFQAESENVSFQAGLGADVYARREISIPILGRPKHDLTLEPSSSPHSTPNFAPASIETNTNIGGIDYESVISAPKRQERKDENNR
jgi:RHS repeat-associated protein